jgi:hypothetical protein
MADALIRAIRTRNIYQATHVIDQLRQKMGNDYVRSLIIASLERLAWDEGDPLAAAWLLRHPPGKTDAEPYPSHSHQPH